MSAMQGRRAAGRRIGAGALMLLHAVTIGCGDVLPTAAAEARENRTAEVAEPTHELRIIVDENDAPVRIQVVRTRVGGRRLSPAEPTRAQRLVGQSTKRQEILSQLPANRRGLEVVFYRGERSVRAIASDAAQAVALDGIVSTANLDDPISPEAWEDPMTEQQAASAYDIEAAKIESMVNHFLETNPEPVYEAWETPPDLGLNQELQGTLAYRLGVSEAVGPGPDCYEKKKAVSRGRRYMLYAGAAALIVLAVPFAAPPVTPLAVYLASGAATFVIAPVGDNLVTATNDKIEACRSGS